MTTAPSRFLSGTKKGCPLPSWAIFHRQQLAELNSSLEFRLHRLHFIRLLAGGPGKELEALSYARHFQPFAHLHQQGEAVWKPTLALAPLSGDLGRDSSFLPGSPPVGKTV